MPRTIKETGPEGGADRIRQRLDHAARTGWLVRVRRGIRGADRIEGFVVEVSDAWTLLAVSTDVQLDGWAAVRTTDITKVRVRGDETCLTVRVLQRRGHWPVRQPEPAVPLDDLPTLLTAAGEGFDLVSVHRERQLPDVCWIGTVERLRPGSVRIHQVDPDARWYVEPTKFRFEDITRVDFGGRYEQALQEFAGPRP